MTWDQPTPVEAADALDPPYGSDLSSQDEAMLRVLIKHARATAAPGDRDRSVRLAAEPEVEVEAGTPKTVREALCVAQTGLTVLGDNRRLGFTRDRLDGYRDVLSALIRGVDVHRPIGVDGKHGDQHTATCGCEDPPGHRNPWSIAIAAVPPTPLAVGDTVGDSAELDRRAEIGTIVEDSKGNVARLYEDGPAWGVTGLDRANRSEVLQFPITVVRAGEPS